MKRVQSTLLVVTLLTGVFTALPARAERLIGNDGSFTNSITLQPIELFSGVLNIEFEHAMARWLGLYAGLDFLAWRGALNPEYDRTFAFGPEIGAACICSAMRPAASG